METPRGASVLSLSPLSQSSLSVLSLSPPSECQHTGSTGPGERSLSVQDYHVVSRKPSNEAVYSFRPGLARSLSQWDVAETGAGLDSSPRHPSSSSWDLARPNTSSSGSSSFSSPAPYHARHIPNITVVITRCVMLMICICRTWQLGSTDTFIECKITIIV